MKEHDATEIAYNNGYADGKRDACKWISVEERLPYKDGDYFVITERGTITDLLFSTQYKSFNADSCCGTKFAIPVTHWMPIPEPPEED